jgi:hypothetical protein
MHRREIPHPITREYGKSCVVKMLEDHHSLYIKPDDGAMGIGIITAIKQARDWYTLQYKKRISGKKFESKSQDVGICDVPMAISLIRNELGTEDRDYLIQEAVSTYEYQGKQTDLRVVMQRDGEGRLGVTSILGRIGGNHSQGGQLVVGDTIFDEIAHQCGIPTSFVRSQVEDISRKCFLAVEKEGGVETADLGLDVVCRENGSPLIIEANIKQGDLFTRLLESNQYIPLEARVREERNNFFDRIIQFGVRQVQSS